MKEQIYSMGETMFTFKQLIVETNFVNVWAKLTNHYPNRKEFVEEYGTLYEKLKMSSPSPNETNMNIYINVFQEENDGESTCLKEFNEDDDSLHFDVCGKDDKWIGYSIASSKFREWLGYYIDENSLHTMTNESLIAHCLWEMTFYYGFDDTGVK